MLCGLGCASACVHGRVHMSMYVRVQAVLACMQYGPLPSACCCGRQVRGSNVPKPVKAWTQAGLSSKVGVGAKRNASACCCCCCCCCCCYCCCCCCYCRCCSCFDALADVQISSCCLCAQCFSTWPGWCLPGATRLHCSIA